MTMIMKAAVGIAVGIAGLFVGYCVYFDQKRRSDPDFKKKLRERRMAKKQAQKTNLAFPDLTDHKVVQRFFVQEVQLGEELLAAGEIDEGINHLANAVAVCGQPKELLQILQKTLPHELFFQLMQRLHVVGEKIITNNAMVEDEVE